MNKIKAIFLFLFFLSSLSAAYALNIGTYKSETDYGLIDGFKFNVFGRREGEKMIELKSETEGDIERSGIQKNVPIEQDEYQLFRFIQENTVPF